MRVDAAPVGILARHYALISLLVGIATWLFVHTLREQSSTFFQLPWLFALLAALAVIWIAVRRGGVESKVRQSWSPWLFPVGCSILALAMSVAGLNGSSSAQILPASDNAAPSPGVILGEAKFIRSDEWIVHTPWLLSQVRQPHPFSSRNASVGGKNAPLVCNLPVAHWSVCFRPEMWPFFAGLTAEAAFSFYWNFKWWSLLCGSYALLLIVTRGHALLSAAGALSLLWTATIQWWFSSPTLMPDIVGFWCFALAAASGAVVHPRPWTRVLLASASAFCALGFLFCCYPPFQIPLLTLFAPLLVALVSDRAVPRHWMPIVVATGVVLIGAALFAWQVRDTLLTISRLVYPGQRFSTGGGESWTSIVNGFLTLGTSELHYPKNFANVVGASSFLNALPLLLCVHLSRWRHRPARDVVQWTLLIFAVFAFLFTVCGFPRFFAKISFWSYATTERMSVSLAVVGVLAICRHLASLARRDLLRLDWSTLIGMIGFGLVLILANHDLHNFVGPVTLVAIWLFYSVTGMLLVARYRFACVAMILFPLALLHAGINPLSHGIPAYSASRVSPLFAELRRSYPRQQWIVVGSNPRAAGLSALLKAAGATVLSGVIAVPNQEMLQRLDPNHENAAVYSRYATVTFQAAPDLGTPPVFELEQQTAYWVRLPLTDQWLHPAGIDGLVVVDAPNLPVPENYEEVSSVAGCRVWVRSPAP
jgi:hypothetical protein